MGPPIFDLAWETVCFIPACAVGRAIWCSIYSSLDSDLGSLYSPGMGVMYWASPPSLLAPGEISQEDAVKLSATD